MPSATLPAVRLRRRLRDHRRILLGVAAAVLFHGSVLVALVQGRTANAKASEQEALTALRAERAAILATAETDVASGRATLGETLIRLGWLDGAEERGADLAARDRALVAYRAMLGEVRADVARGVPVSEAIVGAVARDGRAARYKRMHRRLADALANGGGNCVALSTLAVSLATDAGEGKNASMRVYTNHVAPEVSGFHFGMSKRCHGPGEPMASRELLTAYAKGRATHDREPFAFPKATDTCDDPGEVFGDLQLVATDPAPLASVSASASPPDCRRRTVLEEYEDDVELLAPDGRTLGGIGLPRVATLDLAGHATSAACFDRRAEALGPDSDPETIVLTLGDAAMAAEDAARVFASANELDVAREYEHRLAAHRARAAAPLEQVITRLQDPNAEVSATLAGAGRLVALGEGGRTAMLLASERHRGFWELANLMTRPSSQVGAIKRWSEKPVDVRLDVVDALPCASETFLAQLDSVKLQPARALRAACEVRSRMQQETCALDPSLVHARSRVPPGDQEAMDLAEALLVRHLAARCRDDDAFAAAAERWVATKPEPIARAVASRLRQRR